MEMRQEAREIGCVERGEKPVAVVAARVRKLEHHAPYPVVKIYTPEGFGDNCLD
jgi:hypothetical protein